jgi:hypothetical protein
MRKNHLLWKLSPLGLLVIAWATFVTANQILDNEFRGTGDRWTKSDAEQQTRVIINEVIVELERQLTSHAREPGHAVMHERVSSLERQITMTLEVEREETDILRALQQDVRGYIEWLKQQE